MLVDIALALSLLAFLVPYAQVFFAAACIPIVVLASRHRLRVMVVAFFAGTSAGFVLGGSGLAVNIAVLTVLGGLIGVGSRHGWGRTRTVVTALCVLWPPVAGATVGLMAAFSNLRRLSFDQARNGWAGIARILRNLSLDALADAGDATLSWLLRHWYLVVPAVELVTLAFLARIAHGLAVRVLPRVGPRRARVALGDDHQASNGSGTDRSGLAPAPGPVPLRLQDVRFTYPGEATSTLHDVSLEIGTGELWAVLGANGAGKSSFARVLAGAAAGGTITRPGAVSLGGVGGTAMIFQRPESQVLGVRVRDDVLWGLTREEAGRIDVERLLEEFGLGGLAERETATLSGGQLQRLALAGAVARDPALLVSDESTAMVDAAGRRRLMEQLRALVRTRGTTVVHVTHRRAEIDDHDRLLLVDGGAVTPVATVAAARPPTVETPLGPPGGDVVTLRDVGFVYSPRSPWEHRALRGVTTSVRAGETVLVAGSNGSGKSTLAWILAGLLPPSEGTADLDGWPISEQVGQVALGFQHARLQLLRPRVRDELAIAVDDHVSVVRALTRVGLDPRLAAARIDALSGGQQRRVLLARLLASGPRVLVLDEPFAGLDDEARVTLTTVLAGLRATREVAIVVVSHDLDDVAPFADRLLALRHGVLVLDAAADQSALDAATAIVTEEQVS